MMRCALIKSTNKTMSTQTIPHAARHQRAIARLRTKMLLGVCFRPLALGFGWILVVLSSIGILSTVIALLFGPLDLGAVKIVSPVMTFNGKQIEGSAPWNAGLLILCHLFILAWGTGFVRFGRGKAFPSS
jgi:hypothetical protein